MAKITFLTEEIVKAGGIVRVVNMWSNYFAKEGHEVRIIAGHIDNPYYPFDESIKLMQWKFAFIRKILGIPYNIFQTFMLLNKLKKENKLNLIVDRAIHVEPIWLLRKLGLFKNIKIIYFAHGGSSDFKDFYISRPLVRHKVKMMFEAFDKVICLYDDEKNYPKEVKREKLHFIQNPLPFSPSSIKWKDKKNIVLSLGRVTKEKGIDTLIKAWKLIKVETKEWKLQIVGDGKDKKEFISLTKELELENIEFIDATTDVKPYYEKAKIFVIPSLFEGMPMTILEAMACKCAVISSKTAGGKKLVEDEENGLLFEIGDVDGLSDNLVTLVQNNSYMKKIANKSYREASKHNINKIYQKWLLV